MWFMNKFCTQKIHSCNDSTVCCSRLYGRLAIKNLTPWLRKVDPNFLAGICGAIPILRLQALKKRKCNQMLTWWLFRRVQIWWKISLRNSKNIWQLIETEEAGGVGVPAYHLRNNRIKAHLFLKQWFVWSSIDTIWR